MGVFDPTKCLDRDGELLASTDPLIVDKWGTIKGAAQFDYSSIVDTFGNLGSLAQGPWEFQSSGVETVKQDQETLSTNYSLVTANAPHFFVSNGCTGYYKGTLSGTGNLAIRGTAQPIGGTTYQPGGLLVINSANSASGTLTVESGARLDIGDYNNTLANVRWAGPVVNSGILNYKWKSGQAITTVATGVGMTNNAGATLRFSTDDASSCQYVYWVVATTPVNNGYIELDNIVLRAQAAWSGTGTWRVKSGATMVLAAGPVVGTTQTVYLNGLGGTFNVNGTGVCCQQSGALVATASLTFNSPIVLEGNTRFGNGNVTNATATVSGAVSGAFNIEVGGSTCQDRTAGYYFTNQSNTVSGTVTGNRARLNSIDNALQSASRVILKNQAIGQFYATTVGQSCFVKAVTFDSTVSFTMPQGGGTGLALNGAGMFSQIDCSMANIGASGAVRVFNGHTLTITSNNANTGGSYFSANGTGSVIRIGAVGQATQARVPGYLTLTNDGSVEACVTNDLSVVGVGLLLNVGPHRMGFRAKLDGSPTTLRCSGGINKTTQTTIDLLEPMNAGTFTLCSWAGGTTAISGGVVLGTNLSGRTVTNLSISAAGISITLV